MSGRLLFSRGVWVGEWETGLMSGRLWVDEKLPNCEYLESKP